MLAPPSLKSIPRYPVTAGVAAMAIAVTAMWGFDQSIDWAVMNHRVFAEWELWRTLTSTLPHVGILHLAFNLYWLWTFGTLVEKVYGHLKCAGIYLLLAFGASLAEFSLFIGGVGLSGVGYGLWGMLWVLEKRDPRFAQAVDYQTSRLFVIWFFVCIALTVTNLMPVANAAHGMGAVLGVLIGLSVSGNRSSKWMSKVGIVAILMICLACATVFWPWVNLSSYAEDEVEQAGYEALGHNQNAEAVKWLEICVRMKNPPARAWYNLGIAYQRLDKYEDAAKAYERAVDLPDASSEMKQAAQSLKDYLSWNNGILSSKDEGKTNAEPVMPAAQTNR